MLPAVAHTRCLRCERPMVWVTATSAPVSHSVVKAFAVASRSTQPWPALVLRWPYFGVVIIENFVERTLASGVQEEPLFKEAVYVLPIVHPTEPVSLFEAVAAQV